MMDAKFFREACQKGIMSWFHHDNGRDLTSNATLARGHDTRQGLGSRISAVLISKALVHHLLAVLPGSSTALQTLAAPSQQ